MPHILSIEHADSWHGGFPIGNGAFGTMFWGTGTPISMTLDHCELWDLRSNSAYFEDPKYTYKHLCTLIESKQFIWLMQTLSALPKPNRCALVDSLHHTNHFA